MKHQQKINQQNGRMPQAMREVMNPRQALAAVWLEVAQCAAKHGEAGRVIQDCETKAARALAGGFDGEI